jgi:hypothetical protein
MHESDYAPVRGGTLRIRAEDDFEVTGVHVVVRDAGQVIVAEGDAQPLTERWHFTVPPDAPGAKPAASIEVIARDNPGNVTTRVFPAQPTDRTAPRPAVTTQTQAASVATNPREWDVRAG